MFVWPGHIAGGRRIRKPVSMLDVLPTLLDLLELPQPTIKQGQSLAPLLRGEVTEEAWTPQPVIIDMFGTEFTTNELIGSIEVIDGRWGASLCINPVSPGKAPLNYAGHGDGLVDCFTRAEPLLVYDLWDDPLLTSPLQDRPDLVEKYRTFLEQQFAAHTALRELVVGGGATGTVELTPEQLERLRALGYVR
jgi:arylsulfatase A-like enzyme